MAPSSNKILTGFLLFLIPVLLAGQTPSGEPRPHDEYKDSDQHEKFAKRRKIVGAWQINQLKKGALVIRLKTNRMAIDGLLRNGDSLQARKLAVESYAVNKTIRQAYVDNFKFCKLYFIYSNSSDSLVEGAKSGIFLDSNLAVDPSIIMKESFYLIAERDYGYNSSIGFVPELEARNVKENGNPIKQMAIIVKNKYGHQLKNPFPYVIQEKASPAGYSYPAYVTSVPGGYRVRYVVNKTPLDFVERNLPAPSKNDPSYNFIVEIPKHYTYEKLTRAIEQLESEMRYYYQKNPPPDETRIPQDVKQFLY